jgi:hypothetical protein
MTMNQDLDKRADFDAHDTGVAAKPYYMNKAYGRSLERARALDAREGGPRGSAFQRATIEPESDSGHKVIVEHNTTVIDGGRDGRDVARSEHSFATPEDALRFLRDVLLGRSPGEVGNGTYAEAGQGAGSEAEGQEDPIADVLGEVGGRG